MIANRQPANVWPPARHVSPSQISTYIGCPRKWAYSRLRPRVESKWAAFGSRTHTVLEHWLRSGLPPDPRIAEGRCALTGLPYLPMPGQAQVETELRFWVDDVEYTGRIDLLYGYDPGRVVVVGDHKTTGDLKWAKTPDELAADPQWIVYAYWAAHYFGVAWVAGAWVYFPRTGKNSALPVHILESRDTIAVRFSRLHSISLRIVRDHGRAPESFPRVASHCNAYGGCPYAAECWAGVSPAQRLAAALTGEIV